MTTQDRVHGISLVKAEYLGTISRSTPTVKKLFTFVMHIPVFIDPEAKVGQPGQVEGL